MCTHRGGAAALSTGGNPTVAAAGGAQRASATGVSLEDHRNRLYDDFGDLIDGLGQERNELYPDEFRTAFNLSAEDEADFLRLQKKQANLTLRNGLGRMFYAGSRYDLDALDAQGVNSRTPIPLAVRAEYQRRVATRELAKIHAAGKLYNVIYYQLWKRTRGSRSNNT